MKYLSRMLVWCSLAGMTLSQVGIVSASQPSAATSSTVARQVAADVTLANDGMLRGQLVDTNGWAQSGVQVAALSGDRVVAKSVTDESGHFALSVGTSGVYLLSDGNSAALVRAWNANAAPPIAKSSLLFVSGNSVERGGRPRPRLSAIVGVAAFAGVAALVIAAATDDDDAS